MRKILYLLAVACVSIATLSGCTSAAPDGDEVGILIMKPWFFGHGGICDEPVQTGQTWCALSTDVVYMKVTPIAYDEHIEDAYSNDNTQLDWDIQIILQIQGEKAPILLRNYGIDWYKNNIHKPFTSHFYNLVGNYSPFDLMSNRAVTDSIEVLMKKYMENYIADLSKKKGEMPVTVNHIIIGKGTPNEQMKKEMDRTAAMIQERKSQEQRQATEKAREAAERQRARADRAYMAELNLTTQDFINLKWIQTISEKQGANIDVMVGPATSMWNVRR
jgi:hypothetical protein